MRILLIEDEEIAFVMVTINDGNHAILPKRSI